MQELIDHPDHYNVEGREECIEEIKNFYGDPICGVFCLTNAYKYLYRAGLKEGNTKKQDLQKADWYIAYFESSAISDRVLDNETINKLYLDILQERSCL